jgi:hypothetical protein
MFFIFPKDPFVTDYIMTLEKTYLDNHASASHQENTRVVFGHLWALWKDLKNSKLLRPHIFWETGTFSFRDPAIFARLWRIFQR